MNSHIGSTNLMQPNYDWRYTPASRSSAHCHIYRRHECSHHEYRPRPKGSCRCERSRPGPTARTWTLDSDGQRLQCNAMQTQLDRRERQSPSQSGVRRGWPACRGIHLIVSFLRLLHENPRLTE